MDNGIYAIIRKYATGEGTPENYYEDDGFQDWIVKPNDFDRIYEIMMEITNDHEISQDAASWCELASEGEIYDFEKGEVEIVYID